MDPSDTASQLRQAMSVLADAPIEYWILIIGTAIASFSLASYLAKNRTDNYKSQVETLEKRLTARDEQIVILERKEKHLTINIEGINLPKVDFYKKWDRINSFELYVAACLWNEETPPNPYRPLQGDALTRFYMIQEAIEKGDLQIENKDPLAMIQKTHYQTRLTRQDLIEFATRSGQRPKFLFPDAL